MKPEHWLGSRVPESSYVVGAYVCQALADELGQLRNLRDIEFERKLLLACLLAPHHARAKCRLLLTCLQFFGPRIAGKFVTAQVPSCHRDFYPIFLDL